MSAIVFIMEAIKMEEGKHNLVIRKTRSSGAILNLAVKFLSEESRGLIKLIGIYAAPFFVIAFIISYTISYGPPSIEKIYHLRESPVKNYFVFMLISMVLFIAGLCVSSLIVNKILLMRNVDNELQESESSLLTFKTITEQLKTYWLNFLIVYALYLGALYLIHESEKYNFLADSGYSPDLLTYIVNVFIWYLPMLIFYPPVIFLAAGSLFVSIRDNIGATDAMNNILKISREKLGKMYGGSFLICLIILLIELVVQYIFQYFGMAMRFLGLTASSFIYVIFLNKLVSLALLIFGQTACIILLGSMEDELEGHYMKSKIEQV